MLAHTAEQIMTRNVTVVKKGTSIEEALKLMANKHVSGLPVVDVDGKLVGVITESDLLLRGQRMGDSGHAPLPGTVSPGSDRVSEAYFKAGAATVEEAMTPNVIAFEPKSSVADISRVMIQKQINRVPIVSAGKVVGIISRSDIIRSMAELPFLSDPQDSKADQPRIDL
ncbi:MAG: CBS domain-containing protein [Armatimonadota bacterium]|jgi:CBS domain-containing protein